MKKRKRKHECNGQYCFHRAFSQRSDAEAKKQKVGANAFIQRKWVGRGRARRAYVVMERDSAAEAVRANRVYAPIVSTVEFNF